MTNFEVHFEPWDDGGK